MPNFTGIAEAADAVRTYFTLHRDELPEGIRDKIAAHAGTGASPVDLTVNFAEAIYATRADAPAEAQQIAAGCALLAESFGFHGLNEGGRGSGLAAVMLGQKVKTPPEAKAEFAPAPAPEDAVAPAPAGKGEGE